MPPVEAEADAAVTDANPARRQLSRVPAFDGVRGVAVLLVIWFHAGLIRVLTPAQRPLGGFLGVDVFFVLSGFLITALLLGEQARRGRIRFGAFYRRRAMRLFPVLVAFVIAHQIFAWTLHLNSGREHATALGVLFYYTNWKAAWFPPLTIAYGHLWSLAVEEQFYLVWPLVIAVVGIRARLRTVLLVYGSLIGFVVIRRAVLWHDGVSWSRLGLGTDTRADALLIGALLAHLWIRGRFPKRGIRFAAWLSLGVIVLCFARCRYDSGFLFMGGFTVFATAVAITFLAVLETDWAVIRFLDLRPLRAVGRVSYGLYVWHPLVFIWVTYYTVHWSRPARLALVVIMTSLVTYASWKLIEQPFLRWKDRIEQRARVQADAVAAAGTST
jgi:peptidoglycan/LPS O-acetylase OafA/YrhL